MATAQPSPRRLSPGDAVFCQNAPPPLTVDKQAVDEQSGGFVFVVIGALRTNVGTPFRTCLVNGTVYGKPFTVGTTFTDLGSNDSHSSISGFMIVATVIIILKVSRWHRHKAAEREFGAVQVTEVTEVAQMNPMAMQPNAIVEAHAVQVPSAAAAVESERPFVSPESPPVLSGEKDQPDLGL